MKAVGRIVAGVAKRAQSMFSPRADLLFHVNQLGRMLPRGGYANALPIPPMNTEGLGLLFRVPGAGPQPVRTVGVYPNVPHQGPPELLLFVDVGGRRFRISEASQLEGEEEGWARVRKELIPAVTKELRAMNLPQRPRAEFIPGDSKVLRLVQSLDTRSQKLSAMVEDVLGRRRAFMPAQWRGDGRPPMSPLDVSEDGLYALVRGVRTQIREIGVYEPHGELRLFGRTASGGHVYVSLDHHEMLVPAHCWDAVTYRLGRHIAEAVAGPFARVVNTRDDESF